MSRIARALAVAATIIVLAGCEYLRTQPGMH
jgi:hypothetical protein